MALVFSDGAKKELESLPQDLIILFMRHFEKMQETPPRKHLKHGIPCHAEKVTKQSRIVYALEGEDIYIIHCFKGHKEYERWYNSYK